MLTTLRDSTGRILAACDWWLVDAHGVPTPGGPIVWVNELEISDGSNGKQLIGMIIEDIARRAPSALGAYWQRRKKTGLNIHSYSRFRLTQKETAACSS